MFEGDHAGPMPLLCTAVRDRSSSKGRRRRGRWLAERLSVGGPNLPEGTDIAHPLDTCRNTWHATTWVRPRTFAGRPPSLRIGRRPTRRAPP
ncbi:Conserved oligomeric Golgi complex component 8 [Plantibacter sp. T3]|nr:Conserved oligomeric Golgi complex component 8 [Plantibacter sp. T3]